MQISTFDFEKTPICTTVPFLLQRSRAVFAATTAPEHSKHLSAPSLFVISITIDFKSCVIWSTVTSIPHSFAILNLSASFVNPAIITVAPHPFATCATICPIAPAPNTTQISPG